MFAGGTDSSLLGAAMTGDEEAVMKCLRSQSVNVNEPCADWGGTPLMCAAEKRHAKVCRMLLSRDADYCILDTFGQTCLHRAAQSGFDDVVEVLLDFAPVDLRNEAGQTALHIAAEAGCMNVVGVLLQHRAELMSTDKNGCTPLDLAHKEKRTEVCEVLGKIIQQREFSLPLELQPYTQEILAAYRRALYQGRKRLLRQRIIIIGDQDSGKHHLWSALLGEQEEIEQPKMADKPYFIDDMVYHLKKGQFTNWAANSCGHRKATQRIYEQHDQEVARLLLLDILRSPLGKVASNRLAHDRMQQLVDKLVREVKDRKFHESVSLVDSLSVSQRLQQQQQPLRNITISTVSEGEHCSNDPSGRAGLSTSFRDTDRRKQQPGSQSHRPQPPASPAAVSANVSDGDDDFLDMSLSDAMPESIIQNVTVLWRKVLKEGVSVLADAEPDLTEIHISKVGGSHRLWNIVSPFLSHTALYLATYNLAGEKKEGDSLSADSQAPAVLAAGALNEQERTLRSQLLTIVSQQPPHNYIHCSWEGQEQPMPTFIVCGIQPAMVNTGGKQQAVTLLPLMEKIRDSAVGPHEAGASTGGTSFHLQPPGHDELCPSICFLRREIDLTARLLLSQKGNNSMIPLAWLKLEDSFHSIRNTGCYFMSVEGECLEMARAVTSNVIHQVFDLSSALTYFHSMGWIAYFPQVPCLANTIFLDPPFLINLLAKVLGTLAEASPSKLVEHVVTLHEMGRMEQVLLTHYGPYFEQYSQLGNRTSLLEDFDLAASYELGGEVVTYVPGAVTNDDKHRTTSLSDDDTTVPPLHLVFPDSLPVFGFFQRFLVHVMRKWKPHCAALSTESAQFWIDSGDWQLTIQETGSGSISIFVCDALQQQAADPPPSYQASEGVTSDVADLNASVEVNSLEASLSSVEDRDKLAGEKRGEFRKSSVCTSLQLAKLCNDVLDFVLDCTSTLRDHWFQSLEIRTCFEAAEVGYVPKATMTTPGAAEPVPDAVVEERFVDCIECTGLQSTWCWLSGPAANKLQSTCTENSAT
eukprot:scpid20206/ scgid11643/ Ankycorbin; Ankyrin repeat and coiled-coil structure-containing protein; Novel retinal pigment epithelial cell protein; Retinoic acid-induced protein 14